MNTLKSVSKIIKALADETRARILHLIFSRKGICVCEIREIIGLAQPTISSHLKILENSGLVIFNKTGKWVNYSINPELPKDIKNLIKDVFLLLENDEEIKKDLERLIKVDRNKICSPNAGASQVC